ncbi:MAG TPA: AraC family transcriptional regulator [Allosphingosinicella sp.]|nr:AraC family transcriptional regulator [Allosphingosinicella sp.]
MQDQLSRLRALAARHAGRTSYQTPVPRLSLYTGTCPTPPVSGLFEPKVCLVLQGAKQIMIGEQVLRYDPATFFIASLELPVTGCVVEATPERPYIGVTLDLDRTVLAALISDVPGRAEAETQAFAVSAVTPELLDPWLRLLGLLETPADIAVLAPLVEREILYRLLRGPQGALLRQAAREDSRLAQVRQAIAWIRDHYDRPLKVEALCEIAGMSAASFHRHFRAATAMSPLQYQKSLRLQQARRLLVGSTEAARAAYAVGYESASQFSREYTRMFGLPPARDAARLRETGLVEVVVAAAA